MPSNIVSVSRVESVAGQSPSSDDEMSDDANSGVMETAATFYNRQYAETGYAQFDEHPCAREVAAFVERYALQQAKCLEIGCGRGLLQDLVDDYTGIDLSETVRSCLHKPFHSCSAESLPFDDASFDALWTITVLEHVPNPEAALNEIRRVLRPGGLAFLKPAWHCRWWACEGIPARPYSDLSLHHRWVKLTLGIRESLAVRMLLAAPRRLTTAAQMQLTNRPRPLHYRHLPANYDTYWMVDSDACSELDPLDIISWFTARGDTAVSHPTLRTALLSRSEAVVIRRGTDA
jgi:ubiquinone/menaquinone biosynthesis C-methylase UbiE